MKIKSRWVLTVPLSLGLLEPLGGLEGAGAGTLNRQETPKGDPAPGFALENKSSQSFSLPCRSVEGPGRGNLSLTLPLTIPATGETKKKEKQTAGKQQVFR